MKHLVTGSGLAALAALTVLTPRTGAAQSGHEGGLFNGCLAEFYDADMYNWYSVRNDCDETLKVYTCGILRGGCYSFILRPGAHDSNGNSRREAAENGGFSIYACREGYLPVTAAGAIVREGNQQYRCRRS